MFKNGSQRVNEMNNKRLKRVRPYPPDKKLPLEGQKSNFLQESGGGVIPLMTGNVGHGDDDFVNFLLDLADIEDEEGKTSEANFIDFLIKKANSGYANENNINYFNKLKKLLNKYYIDNGNDRLSEFGNLLLNTYVDNLNITDNAYTSSKNTYLKLNSEQLLKTAGTLEQDPMYVADAIVKVIKIMVSLISAEKRPNSLKNISTKIFEDFNSFEISQKKAPGGAAIGVSLALIKNILNSRDEIFIRIVLDEVRKRLGY